jgi:hypothetical protein
LLKAGKPNRACECWQERKVSEEDARKNERENRREKASESEKARTLYQNVS